MASEKAARILRKRETPLSDSQIVAMSEIDAWALIFNYDEKIRAQKAKGKLPQVCFTGFTDSEKDSLCKIARDASLEAKDSVTKNLRILVTGENPGPVKVAKAEAQGCIVTDLERFIAYVESYKKGT